MAGDLKSRFWATKARRAIGGVTIGVALLSGGQAVAQTTQSCIVKDAADAAVQRQIALIDAAKVNPSEFFNGPHSCIATNLLDRFDLSNLIPDLMGLMSSMGTSLITAAINKAKSQICDVMDQQLKDVISNVNRNLGQFQSSIGNDLFGQLNGAVTPIQLPRIDGLGSYKYVTNAQTNSALGALSSAVSGTQQSTPYQAAPQTTQQSTPQTTTQTPSTSYGGMFQ